jgi:excisionase family DNA binding protein
MDKTIGDSPYLTKSESAAYLRRSLRKIDDFVRDGHLQPAKIDRKLLFKKSHLDQFVEKHRSS